MAYVVRMPKLGMQMSQGEIVEWHVAEGARVEVGDDIAEMESEKTTSEISAREDGVIRVLYVDEFEAVAPGTPLGIVAPPDEDITDLEQSVRSEIQGETTDTTKQGSDEPDRGVAAPSQRQEATATTGTASTSFKASPKAKKVARERDIDLMEIEGSGPQGAITVDDIDRYEQESERSRTVREERKLSGVRKTIADRLGRSYTEAVHVTVHREVNVEALLTTTDLANERLDDDISVVDVVLAVVSEALTEHPAFNATFEDGIHRLYEEHHIAIAVDTDKGLVAPVIEDVAEKSIPEIARVRRDLTDRILQGEDATDDLGGGTFTLTNLGPFGVDSFTPIINPPQVAILGINRPKARATPGDGMQFQAHMTVDLTFDHRVVDGADAARFLETVAERMTTVDQEWFAEVPS